eukprot:5637224-Karenia_brevis.AAC.1
MQAGCATGITQISLGRPSRWRAFSTFSAQLQVSMEAESATGVIQTAGWRPGRWHRFSTFSA